MTAKKTNRTSAPRVLVPSPGKLEVPLWCASVNARLALARRIAAALGEDPARYTPRPALDEATIAAFERVHGVSVPAEYRDFLRYVGDGGVGPDYGLTALAPPIAEGVHPLGRCLELAEIGCGSGWRLVVGGVGAGDGAGAGDVWEDTTAAFDGGRLARAGTFAAWLDEWLDRALAHGAARLAEGVARLDEPAAARTLLEETRSRVEASAVREPALAACAGYVRLALGDAKGAAAVLRALEASGDGAAPGLRRAVYAREIADARGARTVGLAAHPAREVRLALAGNPAIPAELVAALANDADVDVRALAARHANAAPELLASTAEEGLIALACGEAGVEAVVLVELALRNPSAAAGLIEMALDVAEMSSDRRAATVLRGVALSPACSPAQRVRLAASRWPEVRHAAARSRGATAAELRALAADPDPAVRAAIAARRDAPADVLAALASDPDSATRGAVGLNPSSPAACLARLARDVGREWFVRSNPALPGPLIAAFGLLVEHDRYAREVDPRDAGPCRAWADEEDADRVPSTVPAADAIARGKVRHWSFPVPALPDQLGDAMIAYELARRPWLDAPLLERLAADPYAYARSGIAERADVPPIVLERLARDPSGIARAPAAANPRLPVPLIVARLGDPAELVREFATLNPSLPPEHLARMVTDPSPYARRGVARSPHVTSALLEKLARDDSELVRRFVAYAPAATKAILDALAKDADAQTRGRVAFRRAVEAFAARLV